MNFYEIKLNVVIDRNPHQALKQLRSAFDEDGNLVSEDQKERLAKLVKSVLDTTKTFSQ